MNNLQSHFNHLLLCFILLSTVVALFIGCGEQPADPVEWPEVTTTAQPWTRWWWQGSAVTREDLSDNLQLYHDAGLGGVEITPIYGVHGYEDQFIDFLSSQWMDMLRHTVQEARELNMQVDMATGTGWPFGGPHVTSEYAAPRLVTQTYRLSTGERISEPIRHTNEQFNQQAPLQALMAYSDDGEVRDLTANVTDEGYLEWTPSTGDWNLIAVFHGWTGQQVKRAAPGGEGNVIDHYSVDALHHYLSRFDSAFHPYEEDLIRAYFNDSFEVYGSDWTGDIFTEFQNRRGYDLRNHLPALLGQGPEEQISRVKSDYHETIFELLLKEFTIPWRDWAHRNGSIVRNQAHGSPGNLLDLYGAVDIPETETIFPVQYDIPGYHTHPDFVDDPQQPHPLIMKFASSAAHITGKQLVSSETATWLDEHFRVALSQVKPEVDDLFTAGINHIIYHGTAYSPVDENWPGWLFYASTHFGPTNTWWQDFGALNDYIAHTQAFLQQGSPANDILMYFPIY
ncbi:MAG TPA: glycosyl hydrolase, partial [bacterium]|nr:glycosyl hydrolase [bacterium]